MRVDKFLGETWQRDMDGSVRCSLLPLERELERIWKEMVVT
jgi:hypothetical protein